MFKVYLLDKNPIGNNSHGVCRDESWKFVIDRNFLTRDEAEDYVITQNKRMNSYDLCIQGVTDENIIRSRCLIDPDYITKRDYHLIELTPEFKENFKKQIIKHHTLVENHH